MAVLGDDFRIPQFFPSLADIAAANIAIPFLLDSINNYETLERVYVDIQYGMEVSFNEENENDRKAKRLHDRFLLIPRHLRKAVYLSVLGLCFEYIKWYGDNITDQFKQYFESFYIFLKSDCSFDRIKIARYYVMDERVNIRLRFHFACVYCIEESVLLLWREMEACGETINFDTSNNWMMDFWVKWMREGSQVPWVQALKEYFTSTQNSTRDFLLISPFFTKLQPEERDEFLTALNGTRNYQDFLFCLRAATKKEKVKMLENNPVSFLVYSLHWPLQNIFREAAKLVWHFLDTSSFTTVLLIIWELHENWKDIYPSQLFKGFWDKCPTELKETLQPSKRKEINSILNKIRKREMRSNSGANGKMWIRRAGRLKNTT